MILLLDSCQVTSVVTDFDNLHHFDIKELNAISIYKIIV
jgi:hypothetical protein